MPRILIDREKCKGCMLCVEVCPNKALVVEEKLNKRGIKPVRFKKHAACSGCGMCVIMCPDTVIEVYT